MTVAESCRYCGSENVRFIGKKARGRECMRCYRRWPEPRAVGRPCPSGKVKRVSRLGAEAALAHLLERDSKRGIDRPMHVYLCPDCDTYHIGRDSAPATSEPTEKGND